MVGDFTVSSAPRLETDLCFLLTATFEFVNSVLVVLIAEFALFGEIYLLPPVLL